MNIWLLIVIIIAVLFFVLDFVYAFVLRDKAKKAGLAKSEYDQAFYHRLWFGFFEQIRKNNQT